MWSISLALIGSLWNVALHRRRWYLAGIYRAETAVPIPTAPLFWKPRQ